MGRGSLTINSVISEPGQYNVVAFGYDSTALFTAFELTLTRDTNGRFIIGLLKQTEYIVANGQFRPKITWFSLAGKVLGNMPYYIGSKLLVILFLLQELILIVILQNLIYKVNSL